MNIDVVFNVKDFEGDNIEKKTVLVIDVLRATSVMTSALYSGANKIKVFSEVEEVFEYKKKYKEGTVILGGERNCQKIDGFDLGNSPLQYTRDRVENKDILMTTTNGSLAILKAKHAKHLLITSFLNLNAVVRILMELKTDIVFLCAGTDGEFTMEDALCAGVCIDFISVLKDVHLSDSAVFVKDFYANSSKDLHKILENGNHVKKLEKNGFYEDLEFCLTLNLSDVVPIYRDGWIYDNEKFSHGNDKQTSKKE